jgi:hypothetical protein
VSWARTWGRDGHPVRQPASREPGSTESAGASEQRLDQRYPEATLETEPCPASSCYLVLPAGPVTPTTHKAVVLAPTKRVVQERLAGRLLAQPADLASGATRAKRPAMDRGEHRELDRSERIAGSHAPSLRSRQPRSESVGAMPRDEISSNSG